MIGKTVTKGWSKLNQPEEVRRRADIVAHGKLIDAPTWRTSDTEIVVEGDLPLLKGDLIEVDGEKREVVSRDTDALVRGKNAGPRTHIVHRAVGKD